jgi:serine/threonine protein kinase
LIFLFHSFSLFPSHLPLGFFLSLSPPPFPFTMQEADERDRREFLQEMELMLSLHHENVVRMHGMVSKTEPMMILLEFMNEGSLADFLKDHPMSSQLALNVASQVTRTHARTHKDK